MRGSRIVAIVSLLLCTVSPANAFLGIGDVSFDPAAHVELVKLYTEALRLYHVAREQVRRERDIAEAIRAAQRDRKAIRGSNFGALMRNSDRLLSGGERALFSDGSSDHGASRYIRKSRLALESLAKLHSAVMSGLRALDGISPGARHSESVIARATSLLAALATAHAERRGLRRVAEHAAAARAHDRLRRVEAIYQSMDLHTW